MVVGLDWIVVGASISRRNRVADAVREPSEILCRALAGLASYLAADRGPWLLQHRSITPAARESYVHAATPRRRSTHLPTTLYNIVLHVVLVYDSLSTSCVCTCQRVPLRL